MTVTVILQYQSVKSLLSPSLCVMTEVYLLLLVRVCKCSHAFVGICCCSYQGGHKPGILGDFSEHGRLMEFSGNSVQFQGKLSLCSVSSNPFASNCIWCTKTWLSNMGRHAVVSHMSSSWCGMTLDIWRSLLHCDNLWKSIISALEKPGKLRQFFCHTLWPPWQLFVLLITRCLLLSFNS